MPVIGFLNPLSPDGHRERLRGFRQGLNEVGFVEGENLAIEYRWAEGHFDRLPTLAAELVRRNVAVIAATGGAAAVRAAKAATTTVPIVFVTGGDPVRDGLVASFNQPGGNTTGISFLNTELAAKRIDLLRALLPGTARVAVLVNPGNATNAETILKDAEVAARTMGLANPDAPRQHQPRDQCGFRKSWARASRRAFRWGRRLFPQPTFSNGQSGVAPRYPHDVCRPAISRSRRADELRKQQ